MAFSLGELVLLKQVSHHFVFKTDELHVQFLVFHVVAALGRMQAHEVSVELALLKGCVLEVKELTHVLVVLVVEVVGRLRLRGLVIKHPQLLARLGRRRGEAVLEVLQLLKNFVHLLHPIVVGHHGVNDRDCALAIHEV